MSDERVARFTTLVNKFKQPYIDQLEKKEKTEEETQSLEKLNRILTQLDKLYIILKDAILAGGKNQHPDEISNAVCAVFERNGNFNDLRQDPNLKDEFIRVLRLHLKTFPFTPDTKHIHELDRKHIVPSEIPKQENLQGE